MPITKKRCFKCQKRLPATTEFYYQHPEMKDGLLNKCISCTKSDVNNNYAQRRGEKHAYEKERQQDPKRRSKKLEYQRAARKRDPQKYKARNAVNNAIRDGRLQREACGHCGTDKRVQAHHTDYSKPLDVTWLCFKCHRESAHGQVTTF